MQSQSLSRLWSLSQTLSPMSHACQCCWDPLTAPVTSLMCTRRWHFIVCPLQFTCPGIMWFWKFNWKDSRVILLLWYHSFTYMCLSKCNRIFGFWCLYECSLSLQRQIPNMDFISDAVKLISIINNCVVHLLVCPKATQSFFISRYMTVASWCYWRRLPISPCTLVGSSF